MNTELNNKIAKFIINDLKGMCKKFGKTIQFFEPAEIVYLMRLELEGKITRADTRKICEQLLMKG